MCVNLRNAIAEKEQVGADNVLCSNGAREMIFAVVRAVMPKNTFVGTYIFGVRRGRLKRGFANLLLLFERKNDFELQDDFIDYLG